MNNSLLSEPARPYFPSSCLDAFRFCQRGARKDSATHGNLKHFLVNALRIDGMDTNTRVVHALGDDVWYIVLGGNFGDTAALVVSLRVRHEGRVKASGCRSCLRHCQTEGQEQENGPNTRGDSHSRGSQVRRLAEQVAVQLNSESRDRFIRSRLVFCAERQRCFMRRHVSTMYQISTRHSALV